MFQTLILTCDAGHETGIVLARYDVRPKCNTCDRPIVLLRAGPQVPLEELRRQWRDGALRAGGSE